MTTTILGANGKLGRMLLDRARRANLSWQSQARSGPADIIWSGDFDDLASDRIFKRGSTIINMIGKTSGSAEELHRVNVAFVETLLQRAARAGVAHVMLASSAAIYGAGNGRAFLETDPTEPTTPYGRSKVAMEQIAQDADVPVTILRIGNVAGADALLAAAYRSVDLRKPMDLHRDLGGHAPERSYIGPNDLFHAVQNLVAPHSRPPRTVNITHPQSVSLDSMLRAYRAHILPDLAWQDAPLPDGVPVSVTLSAEKLQHYVKFQEYGDPADAFAAQIDQTPRK